MCSEKKYLLEGFEPQIVLRHFENIRSIPHGTGSKAALRSHIRASTERTACSCAEPYPGTGTKNSLYALW
ncbi:MAG: hypothetical protein Q4C02_08585, partial [Eubacteriales bacterium]|nr:hypothetical protein [Eubacteriales bacterium]